MKHQNATFSCLVLISAILLGQLFACNSPSTANPSTNSTETYPFSKINCYIRYIEQNRQLQAEMTFRTDSTKAIEGPVMINEEAMIFKKLPMVGFQYRYLKNRAAFDKNYTFSYTEKNGSIVKMDIGLNQFDSLHIASEGVSKKTGAILEWTGEPLSKEDGLVLVFSDEKGNTFSLNHVGISKGTIFEILPSHIAQLELGKASLQVTRKRTILQQEEKGIKLLTIEYYLKPISFEVKQG